MLTSTRSPRHGVDPTIARTWLLVNGSRAAAFDVAAHSPADQIVLDVEDAVDVVAKECALEFVATWLTTNSAWVRINDRSSPHWSADVDRLRGVVGLSGVMLAKVDDPDHVAETYDRLGGACPVIALIESAVGIEAAPAIARARGTFRLAFGSGDYRRDTGASADDMAMSYPRNRLVVASRIGALPGPIDGPTVTRDDTRVREQAELAVALGMTGKLCVDDRHLDVVNAALSPPASDVTWAREVIADFDARGGKVRDGSDLPRLGRARAIADRARSLGLPRL